jgi:hypothetical protein
MSQLHSDEAALPDYQPTTPPPTADAVAQATATANTTLLVDLGSANSAIDQANSEAMNAINKSNAAENLTNCAFALDLPTPVAHLG